MQIVEVDDAGMNITGKNELLAITDGGKSASKKRKNEEVVKAKTNGAEKSAAKDTDVAMGEHSEDDDGFPVLGKKGGPVIIQTPKKKQAVSGYLTAYINLTFHVLACEVFWISFVQTFFI